ncbi:hypothetical protein [Enterobacter ludwigii]|uniref:hypothetical protein n=1 Tax=Enterobacter ludwigii TaxID=299767 RepID=UPI0016397B07|nr:hypothetical protein [Enterobacter ludwigii]MBK1519173.1 hypothetical protein [Enterobacter ludwigii]
MEESRKAFERFLREEHHYSDDELFWEEDRNCYSIYPVHIAWKAWEGSRADLQVIAPKFVERKEALEKGYTVDYSIGFGYAMDAYEDAIRSAGIKVKE